jgi:hypothetical protein
VPKCLQTSANDRPEDPQSLGGSLLDLLDHPCRRAYGRRRGSLAEMAEGDGATRTGMMIIMGPLVIVVCIWQAAGMVAAHIHELILDQRDAATPAR